MRALFVAALLAGVLAPFASGGQAHACSCGFPRTEADAQAYINSAPLAVVAAFDGYTDNGSQGYLVMAVDRVLNGESIPPRVVIDQTRELTNSAKGYDDGRGAVGSPDCSLVIVADEGDEYLLVAGGQTDEAYTLSACSASARVNVIEGVYEGRLSPYKAILSQPGQPPDPDAPMFPDLQAEPKHKDVPWIPILILALAIPAAALVIPAFFMAKRDEDGKGPPS